MPIVNYVREHIRFMEYACDEKLTSSERLLWYALMHIMNQRAQGNVWPEDFVRISNDRLLSLCPMKFDTMANARNSLKQRGLIEYESGEKNKKSPAYRMIYFYPMNIAPSTELDGASNPENSDNQGGNMGYNTGSNMGYNQGGNMGYNTGDFYLNNIPGLTPYQKGVKEDQEESDIIQYPQASPLAKIRRAWINAYGKEPTPLVAASILQRGAVVCGFDIEVVCEAIRIAALRCADSPVDYIFTLFGDWSMRKIKTEQDLDSYLEEG